MSGFHRSLVATAVLLLGVLVASPPSAYADFPAETADVPVHLLVDNVADGPVGWVLGPRLPDPVVGASPVPDDDGCAGTATIEWGGEELEGELFSETCATVDIILIECSWCGCAYIVEIPGGGYYTFNDTSGGGGLDCGFGLD